MPIISQFYGIAIYMFWREHEPAHCSPLNHWSKNMILHVVNAKYVRDYIIWVRFNDGIDGEVDLSVELEGEVFGPLKDKALFKTVKVDSLLQTVVWDNGADLAPEFLYDNLRISI